MCYFYLNTFIKVKVMILYGNAPIPIDIRDHDHAISYDDYIFSTNGIYKKYKYHFYEMTLGPQALAYHYNGIDFLVQEKQDVMDKSKIITSIPFKHYYVQRKIYKFDIHEQITWVHELDNDVFSRDYFITSIPLYDAMEILSSFFHKKV
tara:strand:+ start:653 stop:1099 length:447 start_codon:yes stop_codon:yes gene_type:complete